MAITVLKGLSMGASKQLMGWGKKKTKEKETLATI